MNEKYLEKKQIENEEIIVYAPNSLNYITSKMIDNTLNKLPYIYDFFGISNYRKFQINLFDNIDKFRKFILSMRKTNNLPEYAIGTYDRGMVNTFIESDIVIDSPLYIKRSYIPSHEITHILYKELITKDNFSNRVVWLDEGLAQYLSGEKDNLENTEEFQEYFQKVIEKTKKFPNLNEIKHGNTFVNVHYNGYDLSYICVKYLFDTKSLDEIRNIVFCYEKSIEIGKTILEESLDYYKNICKFTYK